MEGAELMLRLVLCAAIFSGIHSDNVEIYKYKVTVRGTHCYPVTTTSTRNGWWSSSSSTVSRHECVDKYSEQERDGRRCKPGWKDLESGCNTAICNPPCNGGNFCVQPNECQCKGKGTYCDIDACSNENNCYPGTCLDKLCTCPLGFRGPNCQEMDLQPAISDCQATIFAGSPEKEIIKLPCTHEGQAPQAIWTNVSHPARIRVQWKAEYKNFVKLPENARAPHVQNAPVEIGISKANFRTSWSRREFSCPVTLGPNGNPKLSHNCDVSKQWSEISSIWPSNNQQMMLYISAVLGGYKTGANIGSYFGSNFGRQDFIGKTQTSHILIQYDLQPPVHCLSGKSDVYQAKQCDRFPIYLDNDVTTKSRFKVYFLGWNDTHSGIESYSISVYFLQTGYHNRLVNSGGPVVQESLKSANSYTFDLSKAGVYSIELTVKDRAGNEARARKIILYDNDSKITINPQKPIKILQGNSKPATKWISAIERNREDNSITLTLDWTGHFSTNARYRDGWTNAVDPWNDQRIDDKFGNMYGRRSRDQMIVGASGLTSYSLALVMDEQGGRGLKHEYQQWIPLNDTKEHYSHKFKKLNDGDSVVVWLNANDAVGSGNELFETVTFHVDTTYPELYNATLTLKSKDEFTSSVYIGVKDEHSGIASIPFVIYAKTVGRQVVHSGTAAPVEREPPQNSGRKKRSIEKPCTDDDTSCYCTRAERVCYSVIQEIVIDHCWIDRLSGNSFEIKYTVVNNANLTTREQTLDLGVLQESDISCRPNKMHPGVTGVIVAIIVIIIGVVIFLIVWVKVCHKPAPSIASLRRFKSVRKQSTENELYVTSDEIQPTLANLHAARNVERITNTYHFQQDAEMAIPVLSPPPPYSESADIRPKPIKSKTVYSKDEVNYKGQIGHGRFADILKVELPGTDRKQIIAAAKKLRSGSSSDDIDLLKRKIEFLKTKVPRHVNIVRYIGETEDEGSPVLLLEFCELNLLDWLEGLKEINSTVEAHLINIALNIARGMEHLHKNKIIHKRPSCKNVLLNKSPQTEQFIAKLIGFGPMSDKRMKEVPLNWFSPETIESWHGQPVYNNKTDSWSYGVTLWEMFSKGKTPFSDISQGKLRSDKLLNHLKSGERMKRPAEMPQELYEDVVQQCWQSPPARRPEFSAICEMILSYRDSQEQPLYGAQSESEEEQDIYGDAA